MSDISPDLPPLHGVRVLELGSLIAGPQTARMLADFGADVIKVESPQGGDELRNWGEMTSTATGAISVWWLSAARNKRLITIDLRQPEGQALVLQLAQHCDIVVENFRPGRLEAWNLGFEQLQQANPKIVLIRISGFGQSGPYTMRAGYGSVSESMGGLRYVTGYADRPPVRVGTSIGDAIASKEAVIGTMLALRVAEQRGIGQIVDISITEAVFSITEAMLSEYAHCGVIRERTGNRLLRAAPSNVYQTRDGKWVAIGGNGENVFRRFAQLMGQPELSQDPRYCDNQSRVANVDALDSIISAWVTQFTIEEVQSLLDEAGVPAGPVMSIADIAHDPHFQARGMIAHIADERMPAGDVTMPGISPKLTQTPGIINFAGGELGADNRAVFSELLGLDAEMLNQLAARNII